MAMEQAIIGMIGARATGAALIWSCKRPISGVSGIEAREPARRRAARGKTGVLRRATGRAVAAIAGRFGGGKE